jgi:hypothetical protein
MNIIPLKVPRDLCSPGDNFLSIILAHSMPHWIEMIACIYLHPIERYISSNFSIDTIDLTRGAR